MAKEMRGYYVNFERLEKVGRYRDYYEAESVPALEGPIQEFVDQVVGEGRTVTIIPDQMRGQVNYGLAGEFTITDASAE